MKMSPRTGPQAPARRALLLFALGVAGLLGACQRADPPPPRAQAASTAPGSPAAMTQEESNLKAKVPEQVTPDNHSWVMDAILGKPKVPIKTIGILVYDGVNDLDFTGPRYVLGQSGAKTRLIGIKPGPIKTVMGVQVMPDTTIDEVSQLDILVVPGGFTGTIEAAYDPKVLAWIRAIDKTTTYTASVCTGGWILGATGLLEGRRATTNWYRREEFLQKYKAIPTHERYVRDGKYWTAAGVTAGLDMSLAILNDNWGEKFTQGVMLDMEYDPAPPIRGGTPEKTGWLVAWMMNAMYDAGVNPLIEKLEKDRP
jgi:transcriptional regulator GlxA family with amidase domain